MFYVTMVTLQMTIVMTKWKKYYHEWWMSPSIGKDPPLSWQLVSSWIHLHPKDSLHAWEFAPCNAMQLSLVFAWLEMQICK